MSADLTAADARRLLEATGVVSGSWLVGPGIGGASTPSILGGERNRAVVGNANGKANAAVIAAAPDALRAVIREAERADRAEADLHTTRVAFGEAMSRAAALQVERDHAIAERDHAIERRDHWRVEAERAQAARDILAARYGGGCLALDMSAMAQRAVDDVEALRAERDAAIAERDRLAADFVFAVVATANAASEFGYDSCNRYVGHIYDVGDGSGPDMDVPGAIHSALVERFGQVAVDAAKSRLSRPYDGRALCAVLRGEVSGG